MIAHRLRRLRLVKGISQNQLAELLNVSPSAIGMYEQGRRYPSIQMLVYLANIYEVSLDYLITGQEYPESLSLPPERIPPQKIAPETCPCSTCYWKKYNSK